VSAAHGSSRHRCAVGPRKCPRRMRARSRSPDA
jgi:hypothetical protein